MRINLGESITAAAVAGFGALAVYLGSAYQLGTLGQMGPGYFPVVLGALTILIGLATFLEVRHSDAPPPQVPWRAAALVFLGVLAWALTAERFGLVPAAVALIVLTTLARPPVHVVTMLLTATIASVASVLIFIEGFGLPLHAFRW